MTINYIYVGLVVVKMLYMPDQNQDFNLTDGNKDYMKILIVFNILGYGIPCCFKLKDCMYNIVFCLPHYVFFSPTYIHTLLIYAFCNLDDLSWY